MLVPALLTGRHHVTVLDTFAASDTFLAASCADEHFETVHGDTWDLRVVGPLLRAHDVIIPLAALVGAALCARDQIGATSLNRDAVLDIAKRVGAGQRLIFPTTNSGYGVGEGNAPCTEDSPLRPVLLYGTTKVEAEKAVLDSGRGITLRLATVFGMASRMRLDLLVNDFTWRTLNDRAVVLFEAHFLQNFIHMRDVVKAFRQPARRATASPPVAGRRQRRQRRRGHRAPRHWPGW